jgi:hypothetical protein
VAFVWDLTKETINLPLGCLEGGVGFGGGRQTLARLTMVLATRTCSVPSTDSRT